MLLIILYKFLYICLLKGAYFSNSITDAKSLKGSDFTDSLMSDKTKTILCRRNDLNIANTKTGITTSESLMCE